MPDNANAIIEKMKSIKAKDIMSLHAITVNEDAILLIAAHLLLRFKVSGLPVISNDDRCVGIITATDLFRIMGQSVIEDSTKLTAMNREDNIVKNYMTKNVTTIQKDTSFYDILCLMVTKKIHTLPVIEKDHIVGVVGRRDVINTYYKVISLAWR